MSEEPRADRAAALLRAESLAQENARLKGALAATRAKAPASKGASWAVAAVLAAGGVAGVGLGAVTHPPAAIAALPTSPTSAPPRPAARELEADLRGRWTSPESLTRYVLRGAVRATDGTWVVGDHGTILFRPDASGLWSVVPSGTTADLHAVASADSLVAVGARGTALRWDPRSRRWAPESTGVRADLFAVTAAGRTVVAVGAGGTVVQSIRVGRWSREISDTTADLFGVAMHDHGSSGNVAAVGADGTIVRFGISGWGDGDESVQELDAELEESPTRSTLRAVVCWNGALFAVGDGGVVLTAPWESPWAVVPVPTFSNLLAVAAGELPVANDPAGAASSEGLVVTAADGAVLVDRLGSIEGWRVLRAGGAAIRALTPAPWRLFADDGAIALVPP